METATIINMTRNEAQLVARIGQAVEAERINRNAQTFTCHSLASAIDGLPGVMHRPNEREIGVLLDRMGVDLSTRNYRRPTASLIEALPAWKAESERVLSRALEIVFPGLSPHSNITR